MVERQINADKQIKQTLQPELDKIIDPGLIQILEAANKKQALSALIDCLAATPQVKDREELARGIAYREELMSTGIGMGIAVPHVRLASVTDIVMCMALCRPPITDYDSLDGLPVQIIFMIAAGKLQHAQHLKLLSAISSKLKDKQLRDNLIEAPDAETFYNILTDTNG